uniref:MADF domain-containing protein n=1 Tax=Caenorhabditis japonica TaxID=281687 RepID=A0A8R1IHC1_CAEJA
MLPRISSPTLSQWDELEPVEPLHARPISPLTNFSLDELENQMEGDTEIDVKRIKKLPKPAQRSPYYSYSAVDISTFIEKVKSRPILWDKSVDGSHRKELLLKEWDHIETECAKFLRRERTHDHMEDMMSEYRTTNRILEKFLDNENSTNGKCESERICLVFQDLTKNMSPVEKIAAESSVINFMMSMNRP